jgi:hypothetical protein
MKATQKLNHKVPFSAGTIIPSLRHQIWGESRDNLNPVLFRIEPFLGSDCKTNKKTTIAARQQILMSKNIRIMLENCSVNMFSRQRICMQK